MKFAHRFTFSILAALAGLTALQAQSNYAAPYAFSILAGTTGSNGSTDGVGSAAQFSSPYGVAVDGTGNIYVADNGNHTIRKISSAGAVTTLAGTAGASGSTDGTGSAARFNFPFGVAVDEAGNVYVADYFNFTIRKITPGGAVTTLAGSAGNSGSSDGTGSAARFSAPTDVAVDRAGNVYVADYGNHTIRKITAAGVVTTFAGSAGSSGSSDGTGSAARFKNPNGVAVDRAGNVYVADYVNQTIRKITAAGVVTTFAGMAGSSGSSDGTGSAARFGYPSGVAVDGAGNVFVAEYLNQTMRKITSAGAVTTIAGTTGMAGSTDGTGSAALFNFPVRVAVDGAGKIYVADNVNSTLRRGTPPSSLPAFTTQPTSQTAGAGASVTFTAAASGTPDPAYQWRKNGVDIAGANSATLILTNVQIADAESYALVATNAFGSVASNSVLLILTNAAKATPVITWAAPAAVQYGTRLGSAQLNATASVAGSFVYSPGNSALANPGAQILTATFTPADTANYNSVTAQRTLTVLVDSRIPAAFDFGGYYSRNPEVQALFGTDTYGAWLYYRDHGIDQGEVFDDLFRVEEYLSLYPELFAVFGSDLGGALMHWLTEGSIEGRLGRIPLEFKAQGYFDRNADVAAAVGNNPILAWGHYWAYGIYEGRAYDDELRVFEYLAINADLTTAFVNDWRAAALHWMRYGRTEGRLGRIPLIFSSTEYIGRYPEVAATWGTNPTTDFLHFWLYGIDEGRNFDDFFRVDEYLALNPDLQVIFGTDRRGAFKHWVRYGQAEGRPGRSL